MRILLNLLFFVTLSSNVFGQISTTDKYDFDESKYRIETPDELAKAFLDQLDNFNESEYLELCISKEAMLYMIAQISIMRQDAQNIDEAVKATDAKFDDGIKQYVTVAQNVIEKIDKQEVKISESNIDSVIYEVGDWYGLKPNVMFTDLTVYLSHNGKKYQLQLPQLVRIKDKWFILGPEMYWRDAEEVEWMKKYIEENEKK